MVPTSQPQTAYGFWRGQVAAAPDAVAVIAAGEELTYAGFDAAVNRFAAGLDAAGTAPGTVVAILLPTGLELLRLQLALAQLGAVSVPMIAGSSAEEAAYVLSHSGAEMVVTDAAGWQTVLASGVPTPRLGAFVAGAVAAGPGAPSPLAALEAGDGSPPADPGIRPGDPLAIMYTSGSTGKPKGVVQPSSSLGVTGRALAKALDLGPEDNVLCTLPLFHTAATHMAFASAVAAGGRFTLAGRFSREGFWRLARDTGATATYVFPAQMAILMTSPPSPADRDHNLQVCVSHVRNQPFCDRFGVEVCTVWAMTENSGMGTVTRRGEWDERVGGVGRPYPDEARVRILGPGGEELATGEQGEIWFAHPSSMTEYHADPVNTADTIKDGWVRSGDLGSLDAGGVLSFHGRLKNLIKRSGENISGEEVELTLAAHPEVVEAVAFAVPDPIRTEEVHAVVRVEPGPSRPTPEELRGWCAERLSAWKVPRYLTLREEEMPCLANGKTDRTRLRAESEQAAADDGAAARARA